MTINTALKQKNLLAKKIAEQQKLLVAHNFTTKQNKATQAYDTSKILLDYKDTIKNLVSIKEKISQANTKVYGKIFLMAELKAFVTTLKSIPVKQGVENEPLGFRGDYKEVEYVSTLDHATIDQMVEETEKEIQALQDELDKFNFTNEI